MTNRGMNFMLNKHWKKQENITADEVKKDFLNPPKQYNPYMFWFWIDENPDPENYRVQGENMSKKGISPGYVQDRGFDGALSNLYFECFDKALSEVKKAGLSMGYCEPARLLMSEKVRGNDMDLLAVSLKCKPRIVKKGQYASFDPAFFTVYAKTDENGVIDSDTLELMDDKFNTVSVFRAKDCDYTVFPFYKFTASTVEGCKTNLLSEKTGPRIMEVMNNLYIDRYKEDLGEALSGHFFDWEGDYGYKLCYSPDFEKLYEEKCGENFKKNCALLLKKDKQGKWMKARYNWFDALSDAYSKFLFKYQSDELEKHGLTYTAHLWEERLLGQALLAGSPMKVYHAISLPGVDHLGKDCYRIRTYKEAQSVAEFDRKRFSCEILGVCGWELKPYELRASINNALSLSVDHFIPHGAYSNRSAIDEARYAPDFYNWTPMWDYFDACTDYIKRGSYLVSKGKMQADVLLYNPMESVWSLLGDGAFDNEISYEDSWVYDKKNLEEDFEFGKDITSIDEKYIDAINTLTKERIDFLIADKFYFDNMELSGKTLNYNGFSFNTVVLPPLKILTLENAKKILKFAQNGGYVYAMGELPKASAEHGDCDGEMIDIMNELKSQSTFINVKESLVEQIGKGGLLPNIEFTDGGFWLHQQKRIIDGHSFYFLANNTGKEQKCTMLFKGESGRAYMWNLENGERTCISSRNAENGSVIEYKFGISEGFFVEFVPEENPVTVEKETFDSISLSGEWNIRFDDNNQPEEPTGYTLPVPECIKSGITSELKEWAELGLGDFSGNIEYEKEFELPKDTDVIVIKLDDVRFMAEVKIDGGKSVKRLWQPYTYRFEGKYSKGKHTLHISVGNTMINLLNPHRMDNGKDVWPTCNPLADDFKSGLLGEVKVIY